MQHHPFSCRSLPAALVLAACVSAPLLHASSGISLEHINPTLSPAGNFYRWANGGWLSATEIPPERSNYGSFTELHDLSQERLRAIVEEVSAVLDVAPGSDEQKVGDFFRAYMDEVTLEVRGLGVLEPELARIDAIATVGDLTAYFGREQGVLGLSPLGLWVGPDGKQSDRYIVYFTQSGLGLPDRSYYLEEDSKYRGIRDKYRAYIERIFKLAGRSEPDPGRRVMAIESAIAQRHWTRVQNRDRDKTYNLRARDQLPADFDWEAYIPAAGVGAAAEFIVRQPDYFQGLGELIASSGLDNWKSYLRFHLLSASAPYLTRAMQEAHFDMYQRTLRGTPEPLPRWKRALDALDDSLGEIVGRIYVARHFSPEAKARMQQLVENLRAAYAGAIDELDWMSPQTKQRARDKLAKFVAKIGYPDVWRDYGQLQIRPDDLYGNMARTVAFEHRRNVTKLGKPIDRTEWSMTPQTVNAYYNPLKNEIVFPAGILQPPFFNMVADDAVNYGGIGAVIGHEMGHGFDDQGSKSDGDGNLVNWWTSEDLDEFKVRTARLVDQYNAFSPLPGKHVNGAFTLGENIGDLGGVTISLAAYRLSLGDGQAPVLDGYTGLQRFFIGYAQIWRRKYRDEEMARRLTVDPHSPAAYRVIGVVRNIPEFYKAFEVGEKDAMYLPPEERVKIW